MAVGSVRIKRVYEAPGAGDGHRVLVDRLWPRGMAKGAGAMDGWAKGAAPSAELRRWYHADRSRWAEFRERYLEELRAAPGATDELAERVRTGGTVTLLYAARDEAQNHAMVLAEFLKSRARRKVARKPAKKTGKKAAKKAAKKKMRARKKSA